MAFRIGFIILLLISVLFMPIYVSLFLVLFGIIYFNLFLEGPVLLLVSDLLYGVKEVRFFNFLFVSFFLSLLVLVVVELLKKRLK